jgi:hypothetical protein
MSLPANLVVTLVVPVRSHLDDEHIISGLIGTQVS